MCTALKLAKGKGLVLQRSALSLNVFWTLLHILWRLSHLLLLYMSIQHMFLKNRRVRI